MKSELIVVMDMSGSMGSIRKDALGGFNQFVKDQKAAPGEARLTLVFFDHEYMPIYEAKPLEKVEELGSEYAPRGSTALLDAVGKTLNDQAARINKESWADNVIMAIITDGEENSSKKFDRETIKKMVKHAEEHKWSVLYLVANVDAFSDKHSIGTQASNTANFTASAVGSTSSYASMSNKTTSLRGGVQGQSLSDIVDENDKKFGVVK